MTLEKAAAVIIMCAIALPYVLVLAWCLAVSLSAILKGIEIPKPICHILMAGGLISMYARQNRFWSFMVWYPATQFAVLVSPEAAIGIMTLHLLTALALWASHARDTERMMPSRT